MFADEIASLSECESFLSWAAPGRDDRGTRSAQSGRELIGSGVPRGKILILFSGTRRVAQVHALTLCVNPLAVSSLDKRSGRFALLRRKSFVTATARSRRGSCPGADVASTRKLCNQVAEHATTANAKYGDPLDHPVRTGATRGWGPTGLTGARALCLKTSGRLRANRPRTHNRELGSNLSSAS